MSTDTNKDDGGAQAPSRGAAGALWDRIVAAPLGVRLAGLGAVAFGALAFVFFAGFEVGLRKIFPYPVLARIDAGLSKIIDGPDVAVPTLGTIETTLVNLHVRDVPVGDRANWALRKGGAVASFGEDVLVLTYDGDVFAVGGDHTARLTQIRAPETNRAAFQEIYRKLQKDPEYRALLDRGASYIRYNDFAFFDTDQWRGLVASYIEYDVDEQCVRNVIATAPLSEDIQSVDDVRVGAADWGVIFRTEPCLHFNRKRLLVSGQMAGGRMTMRDGRSIYVSSGDYGFDGMRSEGAALAQDPDAQYGKMLAVDLISGEGEIVSAGHRNIQGVAKSARGALFAVEHGARGGDELNHIEPGENYGWPYETYGTLYSKTKPIEAQAIGRHQRFTPPAFAWAPSPAISGLALVDGFHEAWDGDLLVSALKFGGLYRVRLVEDRAAYAEFIKLGPRIRDIHQHTDGRLVAWTEDYRLLFMTASDLSNPESQIREFIAARNMRGADGEKLVETVLACAECHGFAAGGGAGAPNLSYVHGNAIASGPFAGYSDGLKSKRGRWTDAALTAYLMDAQGFAPGTSMPNPGLDAETAALTAEYLKYLDIQR